MFDQVFWIIFLKIVGIILGLMLFTSIIMGIIFVVGGLIMWWLPPPFGTILGLVLAISLPSFIISKGIRNGEFDL